MFPRDIEALATRVTILALEKGKTVSAAESCTAGLVCAAITGVSGSSQVFGRGFVTYANEAKCEMLGVRMADIASDGAVSERVARAMAEGALRESRADVAVAITGIAGPTGGTADKPVGLVHFAVTGLGPTAARHEVFGGIGREAVRLAAVRTALTLLAERLEAA